MQQLDKYRRVELSLSVRRLRPSGPTESARASDRYYKKTLLHRTSIAYTPYK